jgi:hypothetical protein
MISPLWLAAGLALCAVIMVIGHRMHSLLVLAKFKRMNESSESVTDVCLVDWIDWIR